jgi:L-amino acid N-acyltransferase YncA
MIYRFQVLTDEATYEGWANSKEEMETKFRNAVPDTDFEVFWTEAPKLLTLGEVLAYRQSGMSDHAIQQLDARLQGYYVPNKGSVK